MPDHAASKWTQESPIRSGQNATDPGAVDLRNQLCQRGLGHWRREGETEMHFTLRRARGMDRRQIYARFFKPRFTPASSNSPSKARNEPGRSSGKCTDNARLSLKSASR